MNTVLKNSALARNVSAPKADARTVRSKAALREALISLMEERGFDSVSVADLCERACVNRGTFYHHYCSKEAILDACEEEILDELSILQERMGELSLPQVLTCQVAHAPLPILVDLFDYLRTQGRFLHAVLGPGGDVAFGPHLRDSVCAHLIQSILHKKYRDNPTVFVDYYVSFFASAYLGVITQWIKTGMRESSSEMALISMRLFFIKPGESITL